MSILDPLPVRSSLLFVALVSALATGCGQLVHVAGTPLGAPSGATPVGTTQGTSASAPGSAALQSEWFDTITGGRPWVPLVYRAAKHEPVIPPSISAKEPLRRATVRDFTDLQSALTAANEGKNLATFRAACESGRFRGLTVDAERSARLRKIFERELDAPDMANETFAPDAWCGALAKDKLEATLGDRMRKSGDAMATAYAEGIALQVTSSTEKVLAMPVDFADAEQFEKIERDATQQTLATWWSAAKLGEAPDVAPRMKAAQEKRRKSLEGASGRSDAPFAPKHHDTVAEQKARDGFAAQHPGAKWLRGGSAFADWEQTRNAFGKVLSRSRRVEGLYAIPATSSCMVVTTVVTVPYDGKKFHDESASFRVFEQEGRVTSCK